MKRITSTLREIHFDEKSCAVRFGKDAMGLTDFSASPAKGTCDPLDLVIALFLSNEKISVSDISRVFSDADLNALMSMSLVTRCDGYIASQLNMFPCSGSFIVTDRRNDNGEGRNSDICSVMWLFDESYILSGVVNRQHHLRNALDLCTGSGIHALMASQHCDSVIGVDVNRRALAFAAFNRDFNGFTGVGFMQGDLYEPVAGEAFDLILANPPYNPSQFKPASSDHWSGGQSGEDVLSRIVAGLDQHLSDSGICHIITLLVYEKASASRDSYKNKINRWLAGKLAHYDVMIQCVPVYERFGASTEEEYRAFLLATFSKFEFGVISFRKNHSGNGFYYHGLPSMQPPFVDEQMRFKPVVDHAAFDACRQR